MQIGILGPVLVKGASGLVYTPYSLKLRVLLAVLLIKHNRVVSTQAITDELWSSSPPKTAPTAIQVYISGLRKQFLRAGLPQEVVRISTRPPGYVLEVDEREFDLPCFERGLAAAREAEENGDSDSAAVSISTALALWRGPALDGTCSTPGLQAEARRLGELRMAAYDRRILIDLKLGKHRELIGELYSLTAEYPLRERLWEYLIVALSSQGRPADALLAYNEVRLTMKDQLGMEPCSRLQELQQLVLARSPVV
jgi:DNA-binding SARP family transcriptional activator